MLPRAFWQYLGAFYLFLQSLAATLWWAFLLVEPASRALFRPAKVPDSVLLAFWLPDAVFFIGAGLWAARNLLRSPQTALLPLALHVGGAGYAALFCLAQWLATGEAMWGAILMLPSLCGGSLLLWKVRSGV
ncbi:MAG: hypothetical protein KY445_04870 [Armatimonadetes bacterium]|nr:hypothetical protein [Armatimonadota bacterium]